MKRTQRGLQSIHDTGSVCIKTVGLLGNITNLLGDKSKLIVFAQ